MVASASSTATSDSQILLPELVKKISCVFKTPHKTCLEDFFFREKVIHAENK